MRRRWILIMSMLQMVMDLCLVTNYHQVKLRIVFCVKSGFYDTFPPELQAYAKKTTRYRNLIYVKHFELDIDKTMMIITIALS